MVGGITQFNLKRPWHRTNLVGETNLRLNNQCSDMQGLGLK
jgi:hypothetical protein